VIGLTGGSLRNGYISLADHLDFFPPNAIGAPSAKDGTGALLTLHFDGLPGTVRTDIAAGHKIFRSHGPWRRFFTRHGLTADDSVTIERLSAYEYRIRAAQYHYDDRPRTVLRLGPLSTPCCWSAPCLQP